jgi:hypothetical protein
MCEVGVKNVIKNVNDGEDYSIDWFRKINGY